MHLARRLLLQIIPPTAVLGACSPAHCGTNILQTATEIRSALTNHANFGQAFGITGTVKSYHRIPAGWTATLAVGSDALPVYELGTTNRTDFPRPFELLDTIHVTGHLYDHEGRLYPGFKSVTRLTRGNVNKLPILSLIELYNDDHLQKLVRIRGLVRDAARDESDPHYIHLILQDSTDQTHVMVMHPAFLKTDLSPYLGAEVVTAGLCTDNHEGLRQHLGRMVNVSGLENVSVTTPPQTFANAPDIETLAHALPRTINARGFHQTSGTVLATWGGNKILLKTPRERIIRGNLQQPILPRYGEQIRLVGLPTTDFYNLNLLHGKWEPLGLPQVAAEPAVPVNPAQLVTSKKGHPQLKVRNLGKALLITGVVRYLPSGTSSDERLWVESDGQLVAVDTGERPEILAGLSIGCRVSVSGTCVMNSADWQIDSTEQRATGFFLVPRALADIVILSRPSLWTPQRLMALLGIFAAALLGVIGWNVSLNRRAKAKGRELAAEQLAHVTSELKVSERTRLAVELHDALSQTLTGVSMQIDTAAGFAEGKMPAITKCLGLASRTIDACRMELRNTLWDLRSAALDEPIMDAAIRKTLCQNLAGVDLSVRFNVPRETFSDNTAHAVLKIIRELATNSIRHGKATSLKIAGTIDDGKLLFSVRDNGCGFDPDLAPGIAQGHFGLQGIAERLERLNGEMKIDSPPGKGAKVTVFLPIPRSGE